MPPDNQAGPSNLHSETVNWISSQATPLTPWLSTQDFHCQALSQKKIRRCLHASCHHVKTLRPDSFAASYAFPHTYDLQTEIKPDFNWPGRKTVAARRNLLQKEASLSRQKHTIKERKLVIIFDFMSISDHSLSERQPKRSNRLAFRWLNGSCGLCLYVCMYKCFIF